MPICSKPLLEIWIDQLLELGVEQILVNTHYLSEQVEDFVMKYQSNNMKLSTTFEKNLLGTAGTLMKNIDFIEGETLLIHSDNFTTSNLKGLINKHRMKSNDTILTMLTFRTDFPENCGIVEIDSRGVVQTFHEKVSSPPGNLANGAIYIFDKNLVSWLKIQKRNLFDFSNDVLPYLTGRIQTWQTTDFFIDIGTPESLKSARAISSSKNLQEY